MSTQEYIAKQKRIFQELKDKNKPLEIAARTSMAATAHRIFIKGENSSGGAIGQYNSSDPFYINPDYAPRKTANKAKGIAGLQRKGKTGESKFKNGKSHKTSYQKSYKDFKKNIGQKNDRVRPHLSGDLESDFRNAPVDSTLVKPKRINANEYQVSLTRDGNADKMAGLQKRFTKFVSPTKSERDLFTRTAQFELKKMFA